MAIIFNGNSYFLKRLFIISLSVIFYKFAYIIVQKFYGRVLDFPNMPFDITLIFTVLPFTIKVLVGN